jgi:hypothetical protein
MSHAGAGLAMAMAVAMAMAMVRLVLRAMDEELTYRQTTRKNRR